MKQIILPFVIVIITSLNVWGQTHSKQQLKEFRNHPLWVNMMDDSTVNYHTAKAAFEEFWRGKPTPEQLNEGEIEGEEEHERNIFARIFKSDKRFKEEIVVFAFEHRKFNYWLRKNAPYVREDGTIMSQAERDAIVQKELDSRQAASTSK
jgi:hypothetical protein